MSEAPDSEEFMARVDALLQTESAALSPLAAGLLVATELGIADSRAFARVFGVEHAIVLREIADLSGPDGVITVTDRNAKTLRTTFALSSRGQSLIRN